MCIFGTDMVEIQTYNIQITYDQDTKKWRYANIQGQIYELNFASKPASILQKKNNKVYFHSIEEFVAMKKSLSAHNDDK